MEIKRLVCFVVAKVSTDLSSAFKLAIDYLKTEDKFQLNSIN